MSHTDLSGQILGSQFRILKKLGAGGMGAVYLADQLEMDRKVVVKVLHAEVSAQSPVIIERFRREARAVAQLNHPNIVQVFVFGQADNGQMFLAMEYIEGRDLSVDLEHGPMPQPRALKILDQVCAALIEAHGAGIVHRDLKPENVMLASRHGNPDYVKVLDFGIAKLHDSGDSKPALTQQGTVFGTPRYMAPEQVRGESVDARSDIYALGLILYEMLCGRHPFEATTTIEYLMKHVNEPVPLPSVVFSDLKIQPRIEQIVLRCLAKDPADRFQSVADLQREVRRGLRDFSEAMRGFPNEPTTMAGTAVPAAALERQAAAAGPSLERRAGVSPERRAGGRPARQAAASPERRAAASPERRGIPAWGWALIGVCLVGGVIALVLSLSSSQPGAKADAVAGSASGANALFDSNDKDKQGEGKAKEGTASAGELKAARVDGALSGSNERKPEPEAVPELPADILPAGEPIEGFPLPKGATRTTSTAQAEMFDTEHHPRDLVAFYRAHLRGRYVVEDIPNGLMIKGEDTPFSYIYLQDAGGSYMLMLQRNALAAKKPADTLEPAYGVEFPPGASMIMRSEQATVARSRQSLKDVCEFYKGKYGGIEGLMVANDYEAETPYCTVAVLSGTHEWQAIAVVDDPMAKGAVMISVAKRM